MGGAVTAPETICLSSGTWHHGRDLFCAFHPNILKDSGRDQDVNLVGARVCKEDLAQLTVGDKDS